MAVVWGMEISYQDLIKLKNSPKRYIMKIYKSGEGSVVWWLLLKENIFLKSPRFSRS